MGQIAFNAGIAKRLYDASYRFIGHIPGGLAMATVAGATVFKAICGSSPATAATFASVAVPEMDRYNYAKKLSTGIVATVGPLGVLIPPSVTLIVFWHHYGAVHWKALSRRDCSWIDDRAFSSSALSTCGARSPASLGPKGEKSTWRSSDLQASRRCCWARRCVFAS